jgi:hypothetical protein
VRLSRASTHMEFKPGKPGIRGPGKGHREDGQGDRSAPVYLVCEWARVRLPTGGALQYSEDQEEASSRSLPLPRFGYGRSGD